MASLAKFGPPSLLAGLVLVVPDNELNDAKAIYGTRARIFSDSEVCPTIDNFRPTNWVRQQFIKLAFHQLCETPFYMTLDPDNFATRMFSETDLVRYGKGALDYTVNWDHRQWWTSSADVVDLDHADIPEHVMLVTPCIYSVAALSRMRRDIERTYGGTWDQLLLEKFHQTDEAPGCIENAIYFLHMVKTGTLEDHHIVKREQDQSPLHSSSEVWVKEQFESWDPSYCFSDKSTGIFSLVQGNTYIDPALVREKIGPFIGV